MYLCIYVKMHTRIFVCTYMCVYIYVKHMYTRRYLVCFEYICRSKYTSLDMPPDIDNIFVYGWRVCVCVRFACGFIDVHLCSVLKGATYE